MNRSDRLLIKTFEGEMTPEGFRPIRLMTARGMTEVRYYPTADPSSRAAVWVGGTGGGWDTPARGLYPRLCRELTSEGIASLRIRFRVPTLLEEAIFDTVAGLEYLHNTGATAIAITGHSLGGAVVLRAAALDSSIRAVVALATQSLGAGRLEELPPGCATLFIHGTADGVLPITNSNCLYRLAREPKRLLLLEGAGHLLDEDADRVVEEVRDWLMLYLLGYLVA